MIMAACQSGSMVTLSNSKSLYVPFMVACLVPLMATALYEYIAFGAESGPYLFACYLVFFFYQAYQFKTVRNLQWDRMNTQVDLRSEEHTSELQSPC